MGYPRHYQLTWGGSLYGSEIWTCSLRLVPDGTLDVLDSTFVGMAHDSLQEVSQKVQNWFTDPHAFHNPMATLDWIKYNVIGSDGKYINQVTNQHDFSTPIPSPLRADPAQKRQLPQAAVAITLDTGLKRGLAAHGRFFIPCGYADLEDDGQLPLNRWQNLGIAAAGYVQSLGDWAGIDNPTQGKVAVVSRGRALAVPVKGIPTAYGEGVWRVVNGVRVGGIVDTIRTRRDRLPEDYLTYPVSQ